MAVVDSHAHLYSKDEVKYPPIKDPLRPPPGMGSLHHLREEMRANQVSHAVVIQTSTFYRWDNRLICDTSRANPDSFAGVVTLDPDAEFSAYLLEEFVRKYGVRGFRSLPPVAPRYDTQRVRGLWQKAQDLGIVVSCHLIPLNATDDLASLLERFPDLPVVLDHCLITKPDENLEPTVKKVLELSRFPNLHAKLTFVPLGSIEPYPCKDLQNSCKRIINAFGPERCIWGSNFPCELWCPKITYSQHLTIFKDQMDLTDYEQKFILGETSRKLWFSQRS